ncbi:MAG: hypothetical protein EON58_03210 [Alphaproteobacteria bacterium]|nr:MAG: hypothetical protein EON58_03210 [Alphaproteobacteria bacterium]
MSNEYEFAETDDKPPMTIDERIKLGQTPGHAGDDAAIVPFPPRVRGAAIAGALRGNAQKFVEELQWAGYRLTTFEYRSINGEVFQAVLRFDHPTEEKKVRPVRYWGEVEGRGRVFSLNWIADRKALYGLDRVAERPDAPVLVVEGEKAAEAAARLFPDHVVITWMSGAYNVRRTEMTALAGRDLVLWPDNDPPGRDAMRIFAACAYAAGATSARFVDVPREFGLKWDLADAVPADAPEHTVPGLLASARDLPRSSVAHLVDNARREAEQRRLLGYEPGYSAVKIEAVEQALSVLDAGMFANQWRRIARCLFYAYGEQGRPIFDVWSQGSEEKYREGEPAKLWDHFRQETAFRADTLAWLFRKADEVLQQRTEADRGDKPNVELDTQAVALTAIEELNENHAVVIRGGILGVLRETYDPRYKRFTEKYLRKRDLIDLHVRSILLPADHDQQNKKGDKRISQGALWFGSIRRRAYEGVYFAPGQNLGPKHLNLWRGFAVESSDKPEAWSLLKEHLFRHVAGGDQASYDYLLNWMAYGVQHLETPIGTALVFLGKKGAGKSIITELYGRLFGHHTFVTSHMDDAIGQFNDVMESTILLGLEEAVAPQNKAADGRLKDLITRESIRLEGKFFGVWTAPNHLRIIITSNNELVVRADGSERRYAAFEVTNPHQADPVARRAYFGLMVEQMETGGYEAMLGELLSRDIRNWNAEVIPETPALRRQKVLNLANDPVASFLYEMLSKGDYIVFGAANSGNPHFMWSLTEDVAVPARALNAEFEAFTKAHGMRFSERQLAHHLARYMPPGFKSVTVRDSDLSPEGGTLRVYPFPPLEAARARFEEVTGVMIDREG